jgi:hypothetical protein
MDYVYVFDKKKETYNLGILSLAAVNMSVDWALVTK